MHKELETVIITDEQAAKIEQWLEANSKVPGWLDGYPLGGSYIDTRANGGSGIATRRAYVKLDHATAAAVPDLRSFTAGQIKEFMSVRQSNTTTPVEEAVVEFRP